MPDQVLGYPLHPQDQKVLLEFLKRELPDVIMEMAWDEYFYYFEAFNSLDSLSQSVTGTSGVDFFSLPQPIFYAFTGSTSGDGVLAGKNLFEQDILTFDKRQYLRTQIRVDSVTSVEATIGTGDLRFSTPGNGFGFNIENAVLRGVVNRNGAETFVTLKTIVVDTTYFVEAKLDPEASKVVFFIDGDEKGVINQIPLREANSTLWQLEMQTNSNAAKNLYLQTFEIIQRK